MVPTKMNREQEVFQILKYEYTFCDALGACLVVALEE